MFHTLRRRLVVSHVIPLLLGLPLTGLALIYLMETRVVFPALTGELRGQAALLAQTAADDPGIWSDRGRAHAFVGREAGRLDARFMLLDRDGRLLASSDPDDTPRLNQVLDLPDLPRVRDGEMMARITRSPELKAEIADVLAPVPGGESGIVGVVRLTLPLASLPAEFVRWRYIGGVVVILGALLGVAVGWVLALNLQRPLTRVTDAINELADRQRWEPLTARGPEEITRLVRAFNSLVDRLRGLEESRRQLLANLVHELGRPLGALRSATQALEGGAAEDLALRRELFAGIDVEIVRLRRLLDDLARLHDQVVGTLELQWRTVPTGRWMAQVLAPWREAALRKGLGWDAEVPAGLPAIEVDSDRMAQVLGNLLSNAVKYTPTGGSVSVAAGRQNETLWIRVSDSGPGISSEDRAKIFDPFYRGQASRRFPQGMGLGLAIARDLVAAHRGRIDVDSTPGAGSRFTVWLPLTREAHRL